MFALNLCLAYSETLSPMKQTPEDLRFASDFAVALQPYVTKDRANGISLKQIAKELGVTEPALKKYLTGRTTPCLRTVALAYSKYQLSIPYSGIAFVGGPSSKRRPSKKGSSPLQQLFLPFEIQAPRPEDRLALKLLPTGVSRYQLQVILQLAR